MQVHIHHHIISSIHHHIRSSIYHHSSSSITIEAIGTTSDAEIFTALIPFGDNTDEDDDDEEEDDDDDDEEEKAATDLANIPMKRPVY